MNGMKHHKNLKTKPTFRHLVHLFHGKAYDIEHIRFCIELSVDHGCESFAEKSSYILLQLFLRHIAKQNFQIL